MNTSAKYPRHRFTAETFKSIDDLHCAAFALIQRAERYRAVGNHLRAYRAEIAARRFQRRAFERGMLALTARELTRLCDINAAITAARKAKQRLAGVSLQLEHGISTHAA